jgi:serine/threonine protein kinase
VFLVSRRQGNPPALADPSKFTAEFSDFLRCCLQFDANQRWSASQLLQHPFVRDVSNEHVQEFETLSKTYQEIRQLKEISAMKAKEEEEEKLGS